MERKLLTLSEIEATVKTLNGWAVEGNGLRQRFKFENFAEALGFVNEIGVIAESLDHHPDISFGWGYAEVATTTHDRSGITDFDTSLAAQIDALTAK